MEIEEKAKLGVRVKKALIKWGIMIAVFIAIISAIFFKGYSNGKNKYEEIVADLRQQIADLEEQIATAASTWTVTPSTEITIDFIESEIKDVGELATIEYLYTDAGKFEDPKKLFGANIPFTTKSFIAKWDGVIKAGVNLDKIIVEINDTQKEIIIHMPMAEILSHEVKSIETLDEKDGLFNAVKVDDVRQFDAECKKETEERAIENGVLEKAFENAKGVIEKLVNNDIVQEQNYTIEFEVIE